MQNLNGYNKNNADKSWFETKRRVWLPTRDITTNRVTSRTRQRLAIATPSSRGVKSVDNGLVFDARQIIRNAGIELDGSILEFDTGSRPIGAYHPHYVAVDNDPENVKLLRRNGIRAVLGTIETLPIPENSFDYVLAFSPLIIRNANDWRWIDKDTNKVELRPDYKKIIVGRAIQIARHKVLIASKPIAVDPPFAEDAELIVTDSRRHFYYVVYAIN